MRKKQKPSLPGKLSKKWWLWSLVALLVLAGIGSAFFNWFYSTKDIEAVANQFKAPSSWTFKNEHIRSRRLLCLDGGSCPELIRNWTFNGMVPRETIEELIAGTGWHVNWSECSDKSVLDNCWVEGVEGSYKVILYVSLAQGSNRTQDTSIHLSTTLK